MPKVRTKHFENTDLELVPFERNPDLSEEIQQALSRLMGWDYTNERWIRLRVDANGSIGVVAGPATTAALETTAASCGLTAVLLVAANPTRRSIRIQVVSSIPLYIDDTAAISTASAYLMPSGSEWYSETYRGDVYGITTGGTADVRVIEER